MREVERIDRNLKLIKDAWHQNSDSRFMLLIYNLQSSISAADNNRGKVISENSNGLNQIGYDLFYMEDRELENFLKEELKK